MGTYGNGYNCVELAANKNRFLSYTVDRTEQIISFFFRWRKRERKVENNNFEIVRCQLLINLSFGFFSNEGAKLNCPQNENGSQKNHKPWNNPRNLDFLRPISPEKWSKTFSKRQTCWKEFIEKEGRYFGKDVLQVFFSERTFIIYTIWSGSFEEILRQQTSRLPPSNSISIALQKATTVEML